MEITWYGQSCFRLMERGRVTIVTDPFSDQIGLPAPRLKADVVTVSHAAPGHDYVEALKGEPHVLRGTGEYEIGGVFVLGVPMHDYQRQPPRPNVAFFFDYDNLTVLHVGDLAHVPEQSLIGDLGQVDVLLLPVGGGSGLKPAQAAEVVGLIEPRYVVPMHYALPGMTLPLEPVDRFLKAIGVSNITEADQLKIGASDQRDQTQVVVLQAQSVN